MRLCSIFISLWLISLNISFSRFNCVAILKSITNDLVISCHSHSFFSTKCNLHYSFDILINSPFLLKHVY